MQCVGKEVFWSGALRSSLFTTSSSSSVSPSIKGGASCISCIEYESADFNARNINSIEIHRIGISFSDIFPQVERNSESQVMWGGGCEGGRCWGAGGGAVIRDKRNPPLQATHPGALVCDNDDTVVVHDGDYDDEMEDDDYLACEKKHSRRPSRRVWGRPLTCFSERVSNSDFNPFFNHCCSSYLLSEVPYTIVTWTLSMRHSNPVVYHTSDIQVRKSTLLNRSLQS